MPVLQSDLHNGSRHNRKSIALTMEQRPLRGEIRFHLASCQLRLASSRNGNSVAGCSRFKAQQPFCPPPQHEGLCGLMQMVHYDWSEVDMGVFRD